MHKDKQTGNKINPCAKPNEMHKNSCLKKVVKTYESEEPKTNTATMVLMAPWKTATIIF